MKHLLLATTVFGFMITPATAQPKGDNAVPVIVTPVKRQEISDRVEALGTLRANETVTLSANVTDTVSAIRFEDGQRVAAGDVLVEMANAEETAALKEAQANVSEASRQVQRLKPLVAQGAASKSALDTQNRNLAAAQAQLDAVKSRLADRIITAPFDGVVGLRNISVGALLQPGTTITTLDDDSVMKLDFTVPSVFLSTLKAGIPIDAKTRAYPEMVFDGEVSSIGSQVDPVSRSITVRALIPNEDKILKPGLLMTVTLKKDIRTAVAVPEIALIAEGPSHFVYIIEDGKAVKRQVKVGAREPGIAEITDGLSEGEVIVTEGVMKLSDGITVSSKEETSKNNISSDKETSEQPAEEKDAPLTDILRDITPKQQEGAAQ